MFLSFAAFAAKSNFFCLVFATSAAKSNFFCFLPHFAAKSKKFTRAFAHFWGPLHPSTPFLFFGPGGFAPCCGKRQHYLTNSTIFEKKNFEHKICVLIFSKIFFLTYTSFQKQFSEILSQQYIRLHINSWCLVSFHETWIFSTHFKKYSTTKLHENAPCGSRRFARGWTDGQTYRQTWRN